MTSIQATLQLQGIALFLEGCLELVDWTTGLEYWTGIMEQPKLL